MLNYQRVIFWIQGMYLEHPGTIPKMSQQSPAPAELHDFGSSSVVVWRGVVWCGQVPCLDMAI
jgi:hypothetical protein